jgi:hypothetical protein
MGLDMYLDKKLYLSKYNKKQNKQRKDIKKVIGVSGIKEIQADAIYWRKSNQIHKWFVDNIQEGNDDCGTYEVDISILEKLLATINKVLKSKGLATELLPPTEGFFFGDNEINDEYWTDLEYTKNALKRELKFAKENPGWYFVYSSSW